MTTKKKQLSKEGELRFAAEFVRKGWNVFLPYGEDGPVDLLIEREGEFKRVQIKASSPLKGAVICRLKSSNNWQVKKYTSNEIDLFGIYDSINKKGYLLPIKDFEMKTEIYLRIEPTKNSQKQLIRHAKDFLYFE